MKKCPTGTREWASHSANIQLGCEHDCRYCYARAAAIRFKRATPLNWRSPKPYDKAKWGTNKRDGVIMFPTSHDITPANVVPCIAFLKECLAAGNEMLIVTKPHLSCVERMMDALVDFKDKILFRFTIGTTDGEALHFWEPGAPGFMERRSALRAAWQRGFRTSVSAEPLLAGISGVRYLVCELGLYVSDAIWMGRSNHTRQRTSINCPRNAETRQRAIDLDAMWSDDRVRELYECFKDNPLVKWKDSIKSVVGIAAPPRAGMDI